MKMIRDFAEEIREELNDAEHYAMQAERYKDKDQAVASLYSDLANQELMHMDRLHSQAKDHIQKAMKDGAQVPAGMAEALELEHQMAVKQEAKVRMLLENLKK